MKILVTGGAGFIASNVVDGYILEGHEVVVVDNLSTGNKVNLNPAARFYQTDIRDKKLSNVFESEKPSIVNHHAAQISVPASVEDPAFDADINVIGLINVLECSRRYGVKKVIFSSTGGVMYGDAPIYPTPEDCPPEPSSPYAIAKLLSEYYLKFYFTQYGVDYTVFRYSNIYGPRQAPHGEAGVVSIFMEKFFLGRLPAIYSFNGGREGMIRDYCYVGDIVKANLAALEKGSGQVINLGTGIGTKTLRLYEIILSIMREAGYAKDPAFDNPERGPARGGDLRQSCLDAAKAEKQLNWRPEFDLMHGLRIAIEWFLSKTSL